MTKFASCAKNIPCTIDCKLDIRLFDVLHLKKQHPCGSAAWRVLRIGADFRLKCLGCEHEIMVARAKIEKRIKEVERQNGD